MRLLRGGRQDGILLLLERSGPNSVTARWLRSLFAIYDIEDMAALDLPGGPSPPWVRSDEFLRSRGNARVFEYGSGASTIWRARRALSVVSVEHERDWHSVVSQRLSPYQNAAVGLIDADAELHAGYV
jgi:hypothetical protein